MININNIYTNKNKISLLASNYTIIIIILLLLQPITTYSLEYTRRLKR